MTYRYAYKTSDGTRHEASMDAPSRDAVFETLRSRGIRPIKVVAADGSKANGEIRGVRRRVVVILLITLAIASSLVTSLFYKAQSTRHKAQSTTDYAQGTKHKAQTTRRQIIGDSAIIDKGIATGWSDVFSEEGERFFASFAIPGVKAGQRNTTVEELETALARRIEASPDDSMEARQIKAMVDGMKAEARAYIADGGSIIEYGKRLTERQDAEIAIYERTRKEVERARETMPQDEFLSFWEERNDRLRNLGIKLIPLE